MGRNGPQSGRQTVCLTGCDGVRYVAAHRAIVGATGLALLAAALVAGLNVAPASGVDKLSLTAVPSVSSDCSPATAKALVDKHNLNDFLLDDPVAQVLCGPFTGASSKAMAVAIAASTCWPTQQWAVFSFTGRYWKLVRDVHAFIYRLAAVDRGIREKRPVFRTTDPRCVPSGGTRSRVWRWNGDRLAAGAWVRRAPPPTYKEFLAPTALQTSCYLSTDPNLGAGKAHCQNRRRTADVLSTGRVTICRITATQPCDAGDPGEGDPTLGYGKRIRLGPFRCSSAHAGVTCVVRATGRGFRINRTKVVRLS
jgi:hypothetical protein